MPRRHAPLALPISLLASLLAACGGGGGDGSAPPNTPPSAPAETRLQFSAANEETVVRAALGALDFTLDAAQRGQAPGAAAAAAPQRQAFATAALRQPLALSTLSLPCPLGGRMLVSHDDVNNNGSLDTGDSLSTELQACATAEGVGHGRLLASVREFSSTMFSSRLVVELDVQALGEQRPNGDEAQGSGRFSVIASETGTGLGTLLVEVPSLSLSTRVAGQASTQQVVGLRVQTQRQANRVPLGTQIELSATLLSSTDFGNRSVSLSTAPAFFMLEGDRYPSSGQLLVQGAGLSQLRIVALNASQLRLDRDADGDGSFESSRTLAWSQLWP